MRAEDVFWFIEPHLERIGEDERKKLIQLIHKMDKEPKPKKVSDKQLQDEERKRYLLRYLERQRKRNVEKNNRRKGKDLE